MKRATQTLVAPTGLILLLALPACSEAGPAAQANVAGAGTASLGGAGASAGAGAAGASSATGGGGAGQPGAAGAADGNAGASSFDPSDDPSQFPGRGPGTIFDATILPIGDEKFVTASYRVYVPGAVVSLRGVIIRQHGCGRDGIEMAHDLQWQVLANKWSFALLGTHYDDAGNCANWANLDSGSVQAMQRALAQLASDAAHPELVTVPWAIWGHSGGGNWAYAVARDYPERVIAAIPRSGAGGPLPEAARAVPLLLSAGAHEEGHGQFAGAYTGTVTAFARERSANALVGLSIDPEATHDIRLGRLLAIPYLDACIRLRLPNVPSDPLKMVAQDSGWLGDVATFEVAAFAAYPSDKATAAWLPNQSVASKWAEFSKTGQVTDTSAPLAPHSLSATREVAAVRLSWTADADLESGIKRFIVYRNGTKLDEVGSPFQQGNFGDEPEPPKPQMSYVDGAPGPSPSYEISTVNFSDLESARSESVSAP